MNENQPRNLFAESMKSISNKIDELKGLSQTEKEEKATSLREEIQALKMKAQNAGLSNAVRNINILTMQLNMMLAPDEE